MQKRLSQGVIYWRILGHSLQQLSQECWLTNDDTYCRYGNLKLHHPSDKMKKCYGVSMKWEGKFHTNRAISQSELKHSLLSLEFSITLVIVITRFPWILEMQRLYYHIYSLLATHCVSPVTWYQFSVSEFSHLENYFGLNITLLI